MFTTLNQDWAARRHQQDIVREIFPQLLSIPGARIFAINPPSLGGSRFKPPVEIVISGTNYDDVNDWGNILVNESKNLKLRNANIDYKIDNPRLNLKINGNNKQRTESTEVGWCTHTISHCILLSANDAISFTCVGRTDGGDYSNVSVVMMHGTLTT